MLLERLSSELPAIRLWALKKFSQNNLAAWPEGLGARLLEEPDIQRQYVVCDNTEERSRNHLIKMGLPMHSVKKPPNSVKDGIRKVKQYNIHVHQDSHNLIREINNYKWKVDTKTDTILDVPVKENDDGMDAMRYTIYTYL